MNDVGWPMAAIAEGQVPEDEDRPGLYVPFEFPIPLEMPLRKAGVEWMHFAAARSDLRRVGCDVLDGDVSFGGDPPDFVLKRASNQAVELSQFTMPDRRRALGLARGFRNALEALEPAQVSHLRGHLVMFAFESDEGLPPHPSDAEQVQRAVERLQSTAVRELPPPHRGDLRNGFVLKLVNNPLGAGAVDLFPLPSIPQTRLGQLHAFEIATSYTTTIRLRDTEAIIARLIADHDRPGNDVLLLSAGAPGVSGLSLISDEIAVAPRLLEFAEIPVPRYLKQVLLHRWHFRDVYQLFPDLRCVAPSPTSLSQGGVVLLTARDTVPDAWTETCPCQSGRPFRDCHGTQ